MSVDLDKNRNEIINAWKDVVDTKSDTDWALFGYEGQSNALKVVSTGNDGLIELTEELNSGKILYAFVSIANDGTNLTKYLLINWQGEGAPTNRKATCANHIRDIAKLLTGAHLTLNARTEDDIDPDRILDKLNSIRFAVKENRPRNEENEPQRAAVGTNYSRVIPSREINSKDRDSFWKKEEEEERVRIETERGRQRDAKLELEKEQRVREQREHSEREQRTVKELHTDKTTNGTKPIPEPNVKNVQVAMPAVERSTTQAEEMRQQRNQEVRQLIGSSVDKAKAIFAQNTAAGQLTNKTTKTAPAKPVRNSIARSVNNQQRQQSPDPQRIQSNEIIEKPIEPSNDTYEPIITESDQSIEQSIIETVNNIDDDDTDPYSTIKRSPYTKVTNAQNGSRESEKQTENSPTEIVKIEPNNQQAMVDDVKAEDMIYQNVLQEEGLRARALYDYQADDESEITFDPGDIITHIDQIDEGWWQGLGPDGTYGLFPANYVELIN